MSRSEKPRTSVGGIGIGGRLLGSTSFSGIGGRGRMAFEAASRASSVIGGNKAFGETFSGSGCIGITGMS